jgi:hypothetical protein
MPPSDGKEWQERKNVRHVDFFKEARNVSILLSADGAALWQNKMGVFPIYFQILNLPPELRTKYENMEVYGIIEGQHPANTQLLYGKLVDELVELWDEGFACWDSYTDEHVRLKVMLFAILMDYKGAVDAAQVMDVGSYAGCLICKFWGTFATCLHKMVYMFCKQDPPGMHVACR